MRWIDDRWSVLFSSEFQSHSFNVTFQLGSGSTDTPCVADVHSREVQDNDFVIMGTDGFFDNMFEEDVLEIMNIHCSKQDWLTGKVVNIANKLANRALELSKSSTESPFSVEAFDQGFIYTGGKLDDITVIVSCIHGPN